MLKDRETEKHGPERKTLNLAVTPHPSLEHRVSSHRAPLRAHLVLLSAGILLLLIISTMTSPPARSAGIGVYNTPPNFISITITENDGIVVRVNVSDYNGWEDIYLVNLSVFNNKGVIVEQVTYQQYPANNSNTRIDRFVENTGDYFVPPDPDDPYGTSHVRRYHGVNWFTDNTTQEVVFVFTPFAGSRLHIIVEDTKGYTAEHDGPFTSKYRAPPLLENRVIPVAISLLVASIGSTAAVVNRYHANKMARRISQMKGGGA